jgi:hypothetical protein
MDFITNTKVSVGTSLSEYSRGILKLNRNRNAKTIEKALINRSIL